MHEICYCNIKIMGDMHDLCKRVVLALRKITEPVQNIVILPSCEPFISFCISASKVTFPEDSISCLLEGSSQTINILLGLVYNL